MREEGLNSVASLLVCLDSQALSLGAKGGSKWPAAEETGLAWCRCRGEYPGTVSLQSVEPPRRGC